MLSKLEPNKQKRKSYKKLHFDTKSSSSHKWETEKLKLKHQPRSLACIVDKASQTAHPVR